MNCKKIYPNNGLLHVRFGGELEIVKKIQKRLWKLPIRGREPGTVQEIGRGLKGGFQVQFAEELAQCKKIPARHIGAVNRASRVNFFTNGSGSI